MPETLLTSFEAGLDLGVTHSRVRQLVAEGKIPVAFVTRRGQVLFRPADIVIVKAKRELTRRQRAAAKAERREARQA